MFGDPTGLHLEPYHTDCKLTTTMICDVALDPSNVLQTIEMILSRWYCLLLSQWTFPSVKNTQERATKKTLLSVADPSSELNLSKISHHMSEYIAIQDSIAKGSKMHVQTIPEPQGIKMISCLERRKVFILFYAYVYTTALESNNIYDGSSYLSPLGHYYILTA